VFSQELWYQLGATYSSQGCLHILTMKLLIG